MLTVVGHFQKVRRNLFGGAGFADPDVVEVELVSVAGHAGVSVLGRSVASDVSKTSGPTAFSTEKANISTAPDGRFTTPKLPDQTEFASSMNSTGTLFATFRRKFRSPETRFVRCKTILLLLGYSMTFLSTAEAARHDASKSFAAPEYARPSLTPRPPIAETAMYPESLGMSFDNVAGMLRFTFNYYEPGFWGPHGTLAFSALEYCDDKRPVASGSFTVATDKHSVLNPDDLTETSYEIPTGEANIKISGYDGTATGSAVFDGATISGLYGLPALQGLQMRCVAVSINYGKTITLFPSRFSGPLLRAPTSPTSPPAAGVTFIKCTYYGRGRKFISMVSHPRTCNTTRLTEARYQGYRLRHLVWHGWGGKSAYAHGRFYQGRGFSIWAIIAVFHRHLVCGNRWMYTRYRVTTKYGTSRTRRFTPICGDD